MSKKTALGAAVALAVVAYGGATWYMGQRAQASYNEALEEVRKVLGAEAVVSQDYQKGFFSSQAKLVLQWTPPADADASKPAEPVRVVVSSAVRHGPLAGARLAAAVVDMRFALEGLDEKATKDFAKVTAPTLTTVHGLMGGHDATLLVPAGEVGDEEVTLRWQEMKTEFSINGDRTRVKGNLQWPEMAFSGINKSADEDLGGSGERFAMSIKGMTGDFENQIIDGLWMLAPGKGNMRFAQIDATSTPKDGAAKPLMSLKDLTGTTTIDRADKLMSVSTSIKGKGLIGPVDFESIGFEEKLQRIDADVVKSLQMLMVESYSKDGFKAMTMANEEQGGKLVKLLTDNAQRLTAALPAYSMKFFATLGGQQGELSYGGEVTRAPSADEVTQAGWGPVLLKNSTLHADVRLPKAWLPQLAKAAGQEEFKAEDMDGLIGMAQAAGYVRQEGDNLTSSLKMEGGQAKLNGKVMDLPNFMQ
ncbi:YdgA family protein [Acidovorax sp. 106]|uniref:YdgA family protein n=1 Tax=Acidovorax sp. 106 TaxID=2135637 RepID=UPI000EB3D193|nr:YdgA family protein [Acidovorax sp. 106]RLJ39056.1 uncharacterized protein YdgA (DUF945 family) [Acidovorax sp. 106]